MAGNALRAAPRDHADVRVVSIAKSRASLVSSAMLFAVAIAVLVWAELGGPRWPPSE